MKKLNFLPFILALIITQTGFSQNPGQDKKDAVQDHVSQKGIDWAKEMTQKIDRICDLTPEQEKQVMEVNLRYADKMEEAHNNSEMSEEAMNAHKDKLFEARMGEYNSILSKDQQNRLKDYRNDLKDNGPANGQQPNQDKKDEIKDKAQETGHSKEDVKDRADEKKDESKKEEVKDKAKETDHSKDDVKEKADEKKKDKKNDDE